MLDEIDRLQLQDSTVVVVHADHGWHLGEYVSAHIVVSIVLAGLVISECRGVQNMWEKRTIWELGTRVPYMIHVPWLPQSHGQHTAGLTELIE